MLTCNQRFMSTLAFEEVHDILAVALAALYPLSDERIFEVCAAAPAAASAAAEKTFETFKFYTCF